MPRKLELSDLTIGTCNVQYLYRTGALTIIILCHERYKLDMTAIQEVSWEGSGSIMSQVMTTLYSSSVQSMKEG